MPCKVTALRLTTAGCFRNKEIVVPPEAALLGDWAYAVSKRGQIRDVPDLSADEVKMREYLKEISGYFKRAEA